MNLYIPTLVLIVVGCTPQSDYGLSDEGRSSSGALLGAGFNPDLVPIGSSAPCIEPTNLKLTKTPTATFKSLLSRDFNSTFEQWRFGGEGGFGIKIRAEFLNSLHESKLSVALINEFDYQFGEIKIGMTKLTEFAKTLKTPEQRLVHCGTEFVSSIGVGANFLVALIFNFKDKHDIDQHSISVLLDLLFHSITLLEAKAALANHHLETNVDLRLVQVGGDQQEFDAIKRSLEVQQCGYVRISNDEDGKQKSESQLQECLDKYNGAINYGKNQFLIQLTKAKHEPLTQIGIKGLSIYNYKTTRYDNVGLWQFQTNAETLGPTINLNRRQNELSLIKAKYQGAKYSLSAIAEDLKSANPTFKLKHAQIENLYSSLKCLEESLAQISQVELLCQSLDSDDRKSCSTALDHIKLQALPYLSDPVFKINGWSLAPCVE